MKTDVPVPPQQNRKGCYKESHMAQKDKVNGPSVPKVMETAKSQGYL